MQTVGVTGGIGSGKSTVCHIFEQLEIPVFYADYESKNILQTDPQIREQIRRFFGSEIYDGVILNRKKLASIVFNDPDKLKLLNSIAHPAVLRKFRLWLKEQLNVPYLIMEAALIFESELDVILDKIIVITAPEVIRIKRIMHRDNILAADVTKRINQQWGEEQKTKLADFVISNDEIQLLIPQVLSIHTKILKDKQPSKRNYY
ncbi:MAG: dephospho-CoA kinase [Chitinophagales bacterium]|nr:dephospho-CoA kinase [Chitinophagales bacterium]